MIMKVQYFQRKKVYVSSSFIFLQILVRKILPIQIWSFFIRLFLIVFA